MSGLVLAEARGEVRGAAAALEDHRRGCYVCAQRKRCEQRAELAETLAGWRAEVRTWFNPGSDQEPLIAPAAASGVAPDPSPPHGTEPTAAAAGCPWCAANPGGDCPYAD